jgi:Outer membrane lipoprotein-sorting protein
MKLCFVWLLLVAALGCDAAEVQRSSAITILPVPDPARDGLAMAERLRSTVPVQESEYTGKLIITADDGQFREVPIVSRITLGRTNWQVTYRTAWDGKKPDETLTITRSTNGPGRYELTTGSNATPRVLTEGELSHAFAGSDFSAIDLGLEFFTWPKQRKVRNEMTRSRSCNVLESIAPAPVAGGYARVLTWIDVETDGIMRAEAYGTDGKILKHFKTDKFRKVNGQYQLESMKIGSNKTDQETELRIDLQQ